MSDDGRIIELFTTARHAEWAGDVGPARRLLHDLREEAGTRFKEPDEHPVSLILERARLIDARLERAQHEVPDELIIPTNNLRGIIWRTGERNFELRAYLTDPSWEDPLYRHAHAVAKRYPPLLATAEGAEVEDSSTKGAQLRLYEEQEKQKPDAGRGVSWTMDGNTYLREVTVGDFALVRVKMVWTKRVLPENFAMIRKLLEEPLRLLENPNLQNIRHTLMTMEE